MGHLLSRLAIAVTVLVAQPASAQLVGSRSVQATGCGSAVGGDVRDTTITVVCGMPTEKVVELVGLAASPQAGDRAELMVRLRALIPASSQLRVEAIIKFFQLLGEVPVEEDRLADRFAQIAAEHRRLLEDVKSLRVNDPEVQVLRQQAAAALEIADHATASAKLVEARSIISRKRATLARVLDEQKREEAALVYEQARVELVRLAYEPAAQLFAEAARLLPPSDIKTRWNYLMAEADAESTMGDERGNNPALVRAILTYRAALPLASRTERPLDWAATQNNLGLALWRLGERESGTARLEEAVAAYRAALEERTRERVPLDWATTQNNLGIALSRLGERESGTARLEEAVAAYRAALEERTRERVPLDWADDAEQPRQRALDARRARERDGAAGGGGRGLSRGAGGTNPRARAARLGDDAEQPRQSRSRGSGERESGTARLEEAVAAYRAALEE